MSNDTSIDTVPAKTEENTDDIKNEEVIEFIEENDNQSESVNKILEEPTEKVKEIKPKHKIISKKKLKKGKLKRSIPPKNEGSRLKDIVEDRKKKLEIKNEVMQEVVEGVCELVNKTVEEINGITTNVINNQIAINSEEAVLPVIDEESKTDVSNLPDNKSIFKKDKAKKENEKKTTAPIIENEEDDEDGKKKILVFSFAKAAKLVEKSLKMSPLNTSITGYRSQNCISSGSLSFDLILGGGFPFRRWTTIFGSEGCGKSTATFEIIRECFLKNIPVVHFDYEGGADFWYMQNIGCSTEKLNDPNAYRIYGPDTGEQAFLYISRMADQMPDWSPVNLYPQLAVFVDSIASMLPEARFKKDTASSMALIARLLSENFPLIMKKLQSKGIMVIAVNQLRTFGVGTPFISQEENGGFSARQFPSLRVKFQWITPPKKGYDKEENISKVERYQEDVYIYVNAKILKNKVFPPFKSCTLRFNIGHGYEKSWDVLQFAVLTGQVSVEKGKYHFTLPGFDSKTYVWKDIYNMVRKEGKFLSEFREQLNTGEAFEKFFNRKSSESWTQFCGECSYFMNKTCTERSNPGEGDVACKCFLGLPETVIEKEE